MFDSILNLLIVVITVLFVGFFFLREVIKRWRIRLRVTAGDESLLTDKSVSVKTITDAPEGSVIVSHVPAKIIE
ncbi:MAG: hypothetical protein VYB30_04665 [Candidatus Thermoplasmatota archaeon]|nr:hypothetical protein [Candidatus Thermoplasmatota archaeon]